MSSTHGGRLRSVLNSHAFAHWPPPRYKFCRAKITVQDQAARIHTHARQARRIEARADTLCKGAGVGVDPIHATAGILLLRRFLAPHGRCSSSVRPGPKLNSTARWHRAVCGVHTWVS